MNTGLVLSAGQDGVFQHVLAAHDPHLAVINLDAVDERAQIGLAEGDLAGRELLAHGPREALDDNGAHIRHARRGRSRPLERCLRRRPRLLEVGDACSQDVVDLVAAVLDEPVDPAQPLVSLLCFARQGGKPPIDGSRLLLAPAGQRAQQGGQPLGLQEPVRHVAGVRLSFHARAGVPITLASMLVAGLWLWAAGLMRL